MVRTHLPSTGYAQNYYGYSLMDIAWNSNLQLVCVYYFDFEKDD